MGKQSNIKTREKFSTQMDSRLLADLRKLAVQEGRQIQALLEEAVENLIDKHDSSKPNPKIMSIAENVTKRYAKTLEMLAK